MNRIGACVGLVLCLLVAGCVVKDAGISGLERTWRVGQTTRREVVAAWGNPDQIDGNIWKWKAWRSTGGKFKLGYMGVGVTLSNSRAATREYQLEFGEDGRLRSCQQIDSIPDGAVWSVWPFGD